MVTTIGFTIDIPDSVMGLTFVAFGSSVPDALASMIVAKQGGYLILPLILDPFNFGTP